MSMPHMRSALLPAVAAGLLFLVTPIMVVQAASTDLSGFWSLSREQSSAAHMPELLERIAPGTVLVDDVGAPELGKGDFGGLIPRPAAREAAMRWDAMQQQTVDKVCLAPSIVYAMQGPFPLEIHQATELMVFKLEYFDIVRLIHLDGRAHPDDYPHSKVGHSVGRWDGDILEVDTRFLAASTITNNGLDHSDDIHVIERFRLSPDGRFLHMTQEFEDPTVLENRGARYVVFQRGNGFVFPYDCDPSYGVSFEQRHR